MIARRAVLLVLVVVLASGAGLAARGLRASRNEVTSEQAGDDAQAAAAPSATPVPKWSTRRIEIPAGIGAWSLRISPDGSSISAITAQPAGTGVCVVVDKVSPPSCQPPVPSRVFRYRVSDPVGVITATLLRVADAPENGGSSWIPDGGLLVAELDQPAPGAKLGPKTVRLSVIEKDGSRTILGSVEGASVPPALLSPDGRWLATAGLSAQVTFVDRRGASIKTVSLGGIGVGAPPAWAADGRLLVGKGQNLLAVSPTGAVDRLPGPSGVDLWGVGVAGVAPDRGTLVFRATRGHNEEQWIFVDGRWVQAPPSLVQPPMWVGSHELISRAPGGQLKAFDARTNAMRDLGFTLHASDPRILAYSEPYLMWRDGDAGRIHLLDVRSAYDAVVGVSGVVGIQTYAGGGFLLLHQDGAELLTGADWFARLPPTAAPFASAGPAKPGAKDPFADIKALPRLDQFTTGGALEVLSRTADAKRVRSPDGGWSLEVPSDWRADVGRLRGAELYSFDPTGMDYGGNAPPPGGVRMSIALWPDFDKKGPAWFAENQSRPGRVTSKVITTVPLAGTTAQRVVTQEEQPGPFASTVARWYLRHRSFDDRVIEVILFRADAAALPRAEAALATLELFSPVSGPREPLLSRAEAIQKLLGGPDGKPTPSPGVAERIEAKLVTQKELELAQKSGAGYSLDADTPIWVVIRFGDFEANGRGMCCVMQVPHWAWLFTLIDARTGQGFGGGGGGPAGTEPAWWASLHDRAS